MFRNIPKDGSPGLQLGWQHGCESGLGSQFGGNFYMSAYTWHRDVDITSSNPNIEAIRKRYKREFKSINWNDSAEVKKNLSDYNTIFWTAHAFCRHSVLGILQTADMEPNLPGDDRYLPQKHYLGNIYMIHGKGDVRIGRGGAASMW